MIWWALKARIKKQLTKAAGNMGRAQQYGMNVQKQMGVDFRADQTDFLNAANHATVNNLAQHNTMLQQQL